MKPTFVFPKHVALLFMISLSVSAGYAASLKQQSATVRPDCRITWDKTIDPKVTWYQLTVIDQSNKSNKAVRFIPADTTKISCKDAGATHEGLWDVTVQSCYDQSTCGSPSEVVSIHIIAK
ncbi:MAG TPA: hypothetical protein VJU54_00230 [Nitrospiraceae bacterium]|nr:hypothetical protein [Nitrospiraceae bacterium]